MITLIKWSSLQKSVSKFTANNLYKIDPSRFPANATNIRIGWKLQEVTNTLAYNTVKDFPNWSPKLVPPLRPVLFNILDIFTVWHDKLECLTCQKFPQTLTSVSVAMSFPFNY